MGLRRHVNLADYAIGNVFKYRTKSIAIISILVISSGLLGSLEFIREGVAQDVIASMNEGPDLIVQKLEGGRQLAVPTDWRTNISQIAGTRLVSHRVWGYVSIGNGQLLTVMGINASEYSSVPGMAGTEIVGEGRFMERNDSKKMVVGEGIIDLMRGAAHPVEVGVGSRIQLIAYDNSLVEFEIVGVFASESKIFSYDLIVTDDDSARELLGIAEGECTDIVVWVDYGTIVDAVALVIDTDFPDARVLTGQGIADTSLRTYLGRSGIVALMWAILVLAVVMTSITASGIGSEEARREVGLLKALGFDTASVLEVRLIESLAISILGGSLGISLAIVYDFVFQAPLLSGFILGWSLALINGGIPLVISAQTIFMIYTVSIVPVLVATVVPAWRNAITDPDIVLRGV
jgi:ABC-type lipoprotein release transport system permease subunit